jgi:putative transposase
LQDCHSQLLQQKLKDLDKALMDCFDKQQPNKKFPKLKKKGHGDSFRYPQGFQINGNNIFLPKIGWFKFRQSRKIVGLPKNMTVSYKAGHWYIAIQTEQVISTPQHQKTNIIGIDMGIARFATLSTGDSLKSRNYSKQLEQQLSRDQRSLARKKKFSNNWQKQKQRIQKIHCRIANSRRDYIHWCSNKISKNHAMIVLEDLKVANMSKSAKGDVNNPGKCVKAKSGLNRAILDQGWSEFVRQLQYKQQWLGGEILLVNPKYTSQTCPVENCHHVAKANRKTQSEFVCERCGYANNADVVGAINVLRAGHAQLACGDIDSVSDLAQEPPKSVA